MPQIKTPKKLIEVALPLDDINAACAHEKMPGIGPHPRGIHLWWARRPLAAARAVIFAQMVNDPGYQREIGFGVNKQKAAVEREKLFQIIRDLVQWKNTNNEGVLECARAAIRQSWRETCHLNRDHPEAGELFNPDQLPAFHDPFAGGGAIPLEAQRLGLDSYASDLNPVAVMINKAMIEIPPRFAGQKPVGPLPDSEQQYNLPQDWPGIHGLAEDVRRYGHWMRQRAFERIGHLYPKIIVTESMTHERADLKPYAGQTLTVIAWLWARTVKSPNPAFADVDVPLVRSFVLSSKKSKNVWVEPVIEEDGYQFAVRTGQHPDTIIMGTMERGKGTCIMSSTTMDGKYIKSEAKAGRMGKRLMAMVCEGKRERIYLSPTNEMTLIAENVQYSWAPESKIPVHRVDYGTPAYGLDSFSSLFTPRQLAALTTFSDLVQHARIKAITDAKAAGMADDGVGIDTGGIGATAYGDALAVYLGFVVDRCADFNNSLTGWRHGNEKIMYLFARQAIPMVWDFGEANIIENVVGGFITNLEYQVKCLLKIGHTKSIGYAVQQNAVTQSISQNKVISTDPPYYDNIGYADLSDFFYVWMRRSLANLFPKLFATISTPKAEELIVTPGRNNKAQYYKDDVFFLNGMTQAIHTMAEKSHPGFPVSIYYAFKQSETRQGDTSSSGWEIFLEAIIRAGFVICGTWPMRTEGAERLRAHDTNALASSVILVCNKRTAQAESTSRSEFQRELREHMPEALDDMIGGDTNQTPIAPVDLAQAAIGPGMAIFSRYAKVLNQDGSKMCVHDALILINRTITDHLTPDSGGFDADTLFCDDWFGQYGWRSAEFGSADTLARAKGTSVDGIHEAGIIESGSGQVRLRKWREYTLEWTPETDNSIWKACHHLIRALDQEGEAAAGKLLTRMPEHSEQIRQLAYHLYTHCERKKWAEEARAYNELIASWHAIIAASHEAGHTGTQLDMIV